MDIAEFTKKVYGEMKKQLGEGYRLELKEVKKNNGVVMHGLLIFSGNKNVVPTIYLDSFWESYKNGQSLSGVIGQLLRLYREETPGRELDMNFFQCFDKVRERICYRLIRQKGNEELLLESPHIDFLDLALCFYYSFEGGVIGQGSIRIKNSHAQRWGVKTVELVRLAGSNTARLFPWECISMEDIIRESPDFGAPEELMPGAGRQGGFLEEHPMRILTNAKRLYGAVCMLYPGVLDMLAAREQRSFYILPSSVHEVILLPETGMEAAGDLREMVRDVNRTLVAPEEVLSDNLYYYDFKEKKVKIIN